MEPIRLWRAYGYREFQDEWVFTEPAHTGPEDACEYAALPRADFDALVKARDGLLHTSDKQTETVAWKQRAPMAEQERDDMLGALRKAGAVLSGEAMTKQALTGALKAVSAALRRGKRKVRRPTT